jgi:hypothetical protein
MRRPELTFLQKDKFKCRMCEKIMQNQEQADYETLVCKSCDEKRGGYKPLLDAIRERIN